MAEVAGLRLLTLVGTPLGGAQSRGKHSSRFMSLKRSVFESLITLANEESPHKASAAGMVAMMVRSRSSIAKVETSSPVDAAFSSLMKSGLVDVSPRKQWEDERKIKAARASAAHTPQARKIRSDIAVSKTELDNPRLSGINDNLCGDFKQWQMLDAETSDLAGTAESCQGSVSSSAGLDQTRWELQLHQKSSNAVEVARGLSNPSIDGQSADGFVFLTPRNCANVSSSPCSSDTEYLGNERQLQQQSGSAFDLLRATSSRQTNEIKVTELSEVRWGSKERLVDNIGVVVERSVGVTTKCRKQKSFRSVVERAETLLVDCDGGSLSATTTATGSTCNEDSNAEGTDARDSAVLAMVDARDREECMAIPTLLKAETTSSAVVEELSADVLRREVAENASAGVGACEKTEVAGDVLQISSSSTCESSVLFGGSSTSESEREGNYLDIDSDDEGSPMKLSKQSAAEDNEAPDLRPWGTTISRQRRGHMSASRYFPGQLGPSVRKLSNRSSNRVAQKGFPMLPGYGAQPFSASKYLGAEEVEKASGSSTSTEPCGRRENALVALKTGRANSLSPISVVERLLSHGVGQRHSKSQHFILAGDVPLKLFRGCALRSLKQKLRQRRWPAHLLSGLAPMQLLEQLRVPKRATDALRIAAAGYIRPHPQKADTGGEDAFFVSAEENCVGVADGVGEWKSYGVDPKVFSEELMLRCQEIVESALLPESSIDCMQNKAQLVLQEAFKRLTSIGGSTAVIACMDASGAALEVANLGDSTIAVLRRNKLTGVMEVAFRSTEQQHAFNMPYQLVRLPCLEDIPQLEREGKLHLARAAMRVHMGENETPLDSPADATTYRVPVEEGDLVILGTDGLFDNLFEEEIAELGSLVVAPVEAEELSCTELATPPGKIAKLLVEIAFWRSLDEKAKIPFTVHAEASPQLDEMQKGFLQLGGKPDDIAAIVCWVVANDDTYASESFHIAGASHSGSVTALSSSSSSDLVSLS